MFELFENDTNKPFKNINRHIERDSSHQQKEIIQRSFFIQKVQNGINKTFKINHLENNKASMSSEGKYELSISYQNEWLYRIDDKHYSMEKIAFNNVFEGEWDEEYQSLKIAFFDIEKESNALSKFEYSYNKKVKINEYGTLDADFTNIPVIPKTQEDAKLWFLALLKQEIENKNRYILKL